MASPAVQTPAVAAVAVETKTESKIKNGRGIVKQVLSGDAFIIRGPPIKGPPAEKQINMSNITAPKIARRANPNVEGSVDTNDENFAWASRENLRQKIVGKEIFFTVDYAPNNDRCYATAYLGTTSEGENLAEFQISSGMAEVRKVQFREENESYQRLINLEEQAKTDKKGKWNELSTEMKVRDIKYTVENPRNFVDSLKMEPQPAIIEQVRDGSMMRATLTNSHHQVNFILSGIKCPTIRRSPDDPKKEIREPYAAEARFFVESRLLQRECHVVLEGVSNQNLFLATVLHPKGNITEMLLREGMARCVDWSITSYSQGPEKLRAIEKQAKERKVRIWKNYVNTAPVIAPGDKNFNGKVVQIIYADSIAVKLPNNQIKTIHLSSIRPPKFDDLLTKPAKSDKTSAGKGRARALYDVPYMFEAREFLRKKLIGKKVQVSVDYIKPASNGGAGENVSNYSERTCATVTSGGVNIAEALVSKGLVKVVRHRQDDDARSAHYDSLLAAEQRAIKTSKGLYSKKEPATRNVSDVTGEQAKNLLPFLQRAGKFEAIVEYVFSGSRLKLYLPKESRLITFLLGGIECPRGARNGPNGVMKGDPFADEALAFTKDLVMNREVKVKVDTTDKAGSYIGWLFVDDKNLSELLLEHGLSKIHFTAAKSEYAGKLQTAVEKAQTSRINIFENYEEPKPVEKVEVVEPTERREKFREVYVCDVTQGDLTISCQFKDNMSKLGELMTKMRSSLNESPPLEGAFKPKRNEFCCCKFSEDGLWYRAKVEKNTGDKSTVLYIDYGNREEVSSSKLAQLPAEFNVAVLGPQAHEYKLALVQIPEDEDSLTEAYYGLCSKLGEEECQINIEYKDGVEHITLMDKSGSVDIGKYMISEGLCTVARRTEKRLSKLLTEYLKEQNKAKKAHLNLWRYGDISADDATEFGYKKSG